MVLFRDPIQSLSIIFKYYSYADYSQIYISSLDCFPQIQTGISIISPLYSSA